MVWLAQVQGHALPMFGWVAAVVVVWLQFDRCKESGVEVVQLRFDRSTLV